MDPDYLHDGDVDGVGDGVSLPQQEVDVEGLEELFVVLSADAFVLSGDGHIERRFFRAGFRKRRWRFLRRGVRIECSVEMPACQSCSFKKFHYISAFPFPEELTLTLLRKIVQGSLYLQKYMQCPKADPSKTKGATFKSCSEKSPNEESPNKKSPSPGKS